MYRTTNPATGEVVQEFPYASDAEIDEAIRSSHEAFLKLRETRLEERQAVLRSVAQQYRDRKREVAKLIGLEMGKPLSEAEGEVEIVIAIFEYYADEAPRLLADQELEVSGGGRAFVQTVPVGSLLGVMPWNYPHYQVARFAAPNIVLGNTILMKHASNCPQNSLIIEEFFARSGVVEGAYQNVFATKEQVTRILEDDRNQGVSLTGSEQAGAAVAKIAGGALKKSVLELGGSDAFILLDTDDMDKTVELAINGRMYNAGQACNSPKRFIVLDELYDDFVAGMRERIAGFSPSDPADESTVIGPVSSRSAAVEVKELLDDAVQQGATLHYGGELADGESAYMTPALLTDIPESAQMYREEVFGPVVAIYRVPDAKSAIELANSSPYGLSGMVHSANPDRAIEVADRLDTGMAWINGISTTQADLPFGGVKKSGFGRELGELGILEFANKKIYRVPQAA